MPHDPTVVVKQLFEMSVNYDCYQKKNTRENHQIWLPPKDWIQIEYYISLSN